MAISNITWDSHEDGTVFPILRRCGIAGIEIAPTKIWPEWKSATPDAAKAYLRRLQGEGFEVPAFQAIVYGRPELRLFGDAASRRALHDHLCRVFDLARAMEAELLVFGAPTCRNLDEKDSEPERAFDRAAEFFQSVSVEAASRKVKLCLEPIPESYGCTFVTNSLSARRLVEMVASPSFRLHLDAATMHLAGEDGPKVIGEVIQSLAHYHASEPELGSFDNPCIDHRANAEALARYGYQGWVSIEMANGEDAGRRVADACRRVACLYDPALRVMESRQ